MKKIIQFSLENKLLVLLGVIGILVWGIYSLFRLPIDAVPDITNNQVQVITVSPSLGAEEVERLVTSPVEISMASIPGLEEVRSFSRAGLSVVTLVFEDAIDIYWARQQVNERLGEIKDRIPSEIGQPYLGPVTTGLGEIYQYVVEPAKGYEGVYDARTLRTIQDWIIKRQLLGTPGVADVSSFGGYLKEYEIALDADKLKAMKVSISDVFHALEENNENTGGAYLQKMKNAYFIRCEGLIKNMEDLKNIAVRMNDQGLPVLLKDVATIREGAAIRYGASTKNGKGEVVSAVVMMLKGDNSARVIENVKGKIAEIQKTLPEGVVIRPFLDRTKLVNTAIHTVAQNLIEGALIVIFILLLLLGNVRAGIIVASVIPLSLIFAFGMMNLFGVSGNLMSLGAIDFGLIVDGSVIIVEATLHHLGKIAFSGKFTQKEMDAQVLFSATRMMKSAVFGTIIILIVYLPILILVGTEGKMFRPMAQTVSFAILGAFFFSLTYVPVVTSLFLKKSFSDAMSLADRLMLFVGRVYEKFIHYVMQHRKMTLAGAAMLLFISVIIFATLGGEFLPTLEEGDFAVETRVMTGSSLSHIIEVTTKAEQILLDQFPEVEQVVSKIGTGEVPTDPMPMEAADLMVILKDKKEWVSASDREELANKMAEALSVIPGATFSFQQPIQMRFNELMTGVKQDVAVKIYGEDLALLSGYAQQVGRIASEIEGVEDVYVEEVIGVPQIVVKYKRSQLARYGLSVKEVNRAVNAAFAGASAGVVYESEKRFNLVIRLDEAHRKNIEDVRNLLINNAEGQYVPLHQVAEVKIEEGPYQIQRDNTHRRIIVAFNVRNRDVESVVHDLQKKIATEVAFNPGYYVTYGGQFENLLNARKRLAIAVPAALLMIFILLYFAFHSIKQSILIFFAIPFSAVGGIIALWLRDMPFSISAGVGFIALFGVAVLNGIVLISEFNYLKKQGVADVMERIYKGTKVRLRPVIMTAAVASLGFLPMAISQSGGAEVQRPLATVVIGGLISATLLTLGVLPVLYYFFEVFPFLNRKKMKIVSLGLLLPFTFLSVQAQDSVLLFHSPEEMVRYAMLNNPVLKATGLHVQELDKKKTAAWDMPAANLQMIQGQYNSIYSNDRQWILSQSFSFPLVYAHQYKMAAMEKSAGEAYQQAKQKEIEWQVKSCWYRWVYEKNLRKLLQHQDSIFQRFTQSAELRYRSGETSLLEKTSAEMQRAEMILALQRNDAAIEICKIQLQALLNTTIPIDIAVDSLYPVHVHVPIDTLPQAIHPLITAAEMEWKAASQEKRVEKSKWLPDITVGYFNQSLNGPGVDLNGKEVFYNSHNRFTGFQLGITVPFLNIVSRNATIQAAEMKKQQMEMALTDIKNRLSSEKHQLIEQYHQHRRSIDFYHNYALPQAMYMMKQASESYHQGEIGYIEYLYGLLKAMEIRRAYLETLYHYNQIVIQLEYVMGI